MIKVNAIDHINIIVNELNESADFYKEVFGFNMVEDSREENLSPNKLRTPYLVMGIKGCAYLALHQSNQKGRGQEGGGPIRIAHFSFHVNDFDTVLKKLKAFSVAFPYGGKIMELPHS